MENNKNTFKIVLTGLFVFFALLGVVAFSTFKASNPTNSNVEISIWGTLDKNIFDSYLTKYKQDMGIELKVVYTYKSLSTIDGQLVEAIATGKAPDVILVPHTLQKRYLDKVVMITDIPERTFRDTFAQESQLYIQPNGLFAIPFFIDPLVMYWNRDMFANAGIAKSPSKWSELPDIVGKISQSDNNANIKKSAVSLGEFSNIDNAKALLSTIIMQVGSPIVAYEGESFRSKIDAPSLDGKTVPAEIALQFFTDYSNPKKTVYSWNRSLPSSKASFLREDLAMYFGFASEYLDIKEKNPNLNFDVSLIPQVVDAKVRTTYGELYGFSILRTSPNVAPAFSLITLLAGRDSVSALLDVYGVGPARLDLISAGNSNPIKSIFYDAALISKGWVDPDITKTNKIFQDMVENITTGKLDISGSVSKASLELDDLL